MATIAATNPSGTGAALTFTAASAGGDVVPVSCTLFVQNTSAAAITVTVASQVACSQGVIHNYTVSVPASSIETIGPLGGRFNNGTGYANVTYSSATSVGVAAVTSVTPQ